MESIISYLAEWHDEIETTADKIIVSKYARASLRPSGTKARTYF